MRRTISSRCTTATASRTVTRSSISSAESVPLTSSSRSLYRSSVANAWLARDRIAAESSMTCRWPSTYRPMMRIDWLTEITGRPVCLATRSAVRCRVPDSSVGIAGRASDARPPARCGCRRGQHHGAVHLAQLAQAGGGELHVEREAAGADPPPSGRSRARSARPCDRAESVPGRREAPCRAPQGQLGAQRDPRPRRPRPALAGPRFVRATATARRPMGWRRRARRIAVDATARSRTPRPVACRWSMIADAGQPVDWRRVSPSSPASRPRRLGDRPR